MGSIDKLRTLYSEKKYKELYETYQLCKYLLHIKDREKIEKSEGYLIGATLNKLGGELVSDTRQE